MEEFILPFVLDHVRADLQSEDSRALVLLQFATEEAKHIHLFRTFSEEFERGFGSSCGLCSGHEIARAILSHAPLAVALVRELKRSRRNSVDRRGGRFGIGEPLLGRRC